VWAVVPVKELVGAKQRLASVLKPAERAGLVLAMLEDVLTALESTPGLAGVLLVSRAAEASALARARGVDCFAEAAGADLSESVQAAGGFLVAHRKAAGTLIVPADVPLATSHDFAELLSSHDRLTLVPDREGDGTNCIISTPPNLIRYRFDGHSFKPHVDGAYGIGIEPRIVERSRLALDIDTPDDLAEVARIAPPSHTRTWIERSGIATRMAHPHNASTAV